LLNLKAGNVPAHQAIAKTLFLKVFYISRFVNVKNKKASDNFLPPARYKGKLLPYEFNYK
tara:strand:- start:3207 stop:3386 length:180 start_codon:yes stop_codon:yes gene_type:complete